MQRDSGRVDQGAQKAARPIGVEGFDAHPREVDVVRQKRTARQIESHERQRLGDRHGGPAEAADGLPLAQRPAQRPAHGDRDGLDSFFGLALAATREARGAGPDREVEVGVTRGQSEQVVEKRVAGRHGGTPVPVEHDLDPDGPLPPVLVTDHRPAWGAGVHRLARRRAERA